MNTQERKRIEMALLEQMGPDNFAQAKESLTAVLNTLEDIFRPSFLAALPLPYIVNMTALYQEKKINPKTLTEVAIAYALEPNAKNRRMLKELLSVTHFVLERRIPDTTH